ncbi:hypothetical protein RR42_s1053 [Cupriavidus basilensis]|uniref:Uncharacterized protein n=1 Tax=Cupriavidus basilensis TaxID=68895 RepID=A0A0C4YAW4_9BURK|nr:hypothetical protein RR42_s1053 [Cupriavidus basilensis]
MIDISKNLAMPHGHRATRDSQPWRAHSRRDIGCGGCGGCVVAMATERNANFCEGGLPACAGFLVATQ